MLLESTTQSWINNEISSGIEEILGMPASTKDHIYADKQVEVQDFVFNAEVTSVFADMIGRSVPGYEVLSQLVQSMARKFVAEDTNVYDLGCSLGNASLSVARALYPSKARIFAVDSSPAMIQHLVERIEGMDPDPGISPICCDVAEISMQNASLVILNYTLQFIDPRSRDALITKIYSGLREGAALLLSEKIIREDLDEEHLMRDLHEGYKNIRGYSDLEISQKREALENVMIRDTDACHCERLHRAGFSRLYVLMKYLNFISYIAIK